MVKIGNVEIRGPLTLAPMAGVTDAPFRALCRAQGAALTCTEMVSAKALVYHDEKTKQLTHDLHANGPFGVMTDYEAKFYDQGITINRCVAVKTEDTKCDLYPGTSTGCAPV